MEEKQIADDLKQNITPAYKTDIAPVTSNDGTLSYATDFPLDELIQYKLHDYFEEQYKPNGEENKQRLSFIYSEVSNLIDNQDYGFVIAKIRDLERIIGTATSDNRLYRLYQWLKLDKTRRSIESEMGTVIRE